jgi:hypothetical protein
VMSTKTFPTRLRLDQGRRETAATIGYRADVAQLVEHFTRNDEGYGLYRPHSA